MLLPMCLGLVAGLASALPQTSQDGQNVTLNGTGLGGEGNADPFIPPGLEVDIRMTEPPAAITRNNFLFGIVNTISQIIESGSLQGLAPPVTVFRGPASAPAAAVIGMFNPARRSTNAVWAASLWVLIDGIVTSPQFFVATALDMRDGRKTIGTASIQPAAGTANVDSGPMSKFNGTDAVEEVGDPVYVCHYENLLPVQRIPPVPIYHIVAKSLLTVAYLPQDKPIQSIINVYSIRFPFNLQMTFVPAHGEPVSPMTTTAAIRGLKFLLNRIYRSGGGITLGKVVINELNGQRLIPVGDIAVSNYLSRASESESAATGTNETTGGIQPVASGKFVPSS